MQLYLIDTEKEHIKTKNDRNNDKETRSESKKHLPLCSCQRILIVFIIIIL